MDKGAYFATRDLLDGNRAYRGLFLDALYMGALADNRLKTAFGEKDAEELTLRPVAVRRCAPSEEDGAPGPSEASATFSAVSSNEAIARLEGRLAPKAAVQSAASVLGMLARNRAILEVIAVDGILYEGTLADLQKDESVPDDADIFFGYLTTPAGCRALRDVLAESTFERLCEEKPQHVAGFRLVLALCATPEGCTTKELEGPLDEAGHLRRHQRTGLPTVYPSYFTGALEAVGLLRWDKSHWQTTAKGSAALGTVAGE